MSRYFTAGAKLVLGVATAASIGASSHAASFAPISVPRPLITVPRPAVATPNLVRPNLKTSVMPIISGYGYGPVARRVALEALVKPGSYTPLHTGQKAWRFRTPAEIDYQIVTPNPNGTVTTTSVLTNGGRETHTTPKPSPAKPAVDDEIYHEDDVKPAAKPQLANPGPNIAPPVDDDIIEDD